MTDGPTIRDWPGYCPKISEVAGRPMYSGGGGGSISYVFEFDAAATRAGLADADTSAAAQPGAQTRSLKLGGYMMPLLHAVDAVHAVRDAQVQTHATANSVRREISVTAVETTEAANAGALSC